ncbi:MAG: mandelate racemase/muconate lactonizing enzyme family protein [Deltaproteobacteria bacterium]|nr:mandelate racemase/muconate lactonizing enzyme family protein [Deltaproteobacteria bacterium]
MKIQKIEAIPFEAGPLSQLFVQIHTDEGLVGLGETWYGLPTNPIKSAIEDTLLPILLNEDSSRIEYLWNRMYRHAYRYGTEGVLLCAISGIDLALWDLMGQRVQRPVIQLIGGIVREGIRAYASFPPYHEEKILLREVERALQLGFAGIKLHEVDLALITKAAKAVPEGYPLMLDVNGLWNAVETEEKARTLEKLNIYWLEEPLFPMQDHEAMARVRRRINLRFASGENEFTLMGFDRLLKSGAIDFVQPEITKIGGLTTARKISVLADLHNIPVCPHSFRIGPAAYANMHWALSQQNMDWMEIPLLPEGRSFPSKPPLLKLRNGQVILPEGPGFGFPKQRE